MLVRTTVLSVLVSCLTSGVVASSHSAQVYLFPTNPIQHHTPPEVNPTEANALISQHLGIPMHESLGDLALEWWNTIARPVLGPGQLEVGSGNDGAILLVVESDHPEDFMPTHAKTSFTIPNSPPANMFTDLIHAYLERAHQLFKDVYSSFTAEIKHSEIYKSLLDIFDLSSEAASMFVEEIGALVGYEESDSSDEQFATFEIKGLAQLEETEGRESEVYLTAAKSVQAVLGRPSFQSRKVALIIVPRAAHKLHTRSFEETSASPADLPTRNRAVHSISTCFTSNDTCSESTNGCSGHGSCSQITIAGKSCFTCTCSVTKNNKGRKEWWAGQSCEKKDLSSPFVLLAGSGIFLILLTGFAISLLYSIGDETLPNTLTAGAVGHGGKRD